MKHIAHPVPCTVAILTHNSAKTLPRALESVGDFSDIIVCDGNSTDGTLEIARSYGARILKQDPRFLNSEGRIQNFSGVRNQSLEAAVFDWFFFLDSDEYIGIDLHNDIARVVLEEPCAYWIPRIYEHNGRHIECSVAYPSQQMRLFNKRVTMKFIKEVHERIELLPHTTPSWLVSPMFVPLPGTARELVRKWRGYLLLEQGRRKSLTVRKWLRGSLRDGGVAVLYALRLARILVFCRGTRLPVSYEFARIWYQFALIKDSFTKIRSL